MTSNRLRIHRIHFTASRGYHLLPAVFCIFLLLSLLASIAKAETPIRIGYEQNHPMASTTAGGKAQGIMIDLVEEVARKADWKITYAPCIWKECLTNLETGAIDLLVGIAHTPERAERYTYNRHTVISNWGLLYSRPDQKIESYKDLHGKRIAVVENDVYCNTFIKMMQEFSIRCDLVFARSFIEIFSMIDRGEVDAGVANRFFSLLNEGFFKVKATPIIFSPVSVQVAAPKGKGQEVLAAFDYHLESMKKDRASVYHQSLKQWLGIEGSEYHLPRWVWWLFYGISGTGILLGGFTLLLRREVQRNTKDLLHEVTERRRSEEQLRLVLDNMQEILIHAAQDGTILYISHGIELLGFLPEEIVGTSFRKLCKNTDEFDKLLTTLQTKETITGLQIPLLSKNGSERLVSLNADLLWEAGGTTASIIATGSDVTEQFRLHALMAQTEKMMMVGGLAAGMAHEINNPLGIIMQHTQNIERRIFSDLPANLEAAEKTGVELQQVRDYLQQRGIPTFLQQIHQASDRMSRIISNMLKFSRKSESKMESASLESVIEQTLELAENDYNLKKHYDFKNITIVREYDIDLPKVPLIVLEMEQVVLNLLKNAAQAMALANTVKEPRITLRTKHSGDWVCIEVEDNGPGMSPDVQQRIFEPFFTTKETGVGTGLGLSVSSAIITNNHHGRIEVRSEPDQGTCFTIYLPLTYKPVAIPQRGPI